MATSRKKGGQTPEKRRPATSPEAREDELISLATDLAEKQIREGTVSAQVLSHFLKMATRRERLEQEKLKNETILLQAKREAIESEARVEELYRDALKAMKEYSGEDDDDQDVY